jgi:hypothetical protein
MHTIVGSLVVLTYYRLKGVGELGYYGFGFFFGVGGIGVRVGFALGFGIGDLMIGMAFWVESFWRMWRIGV